MKTFEEIMASGKLWNYKGAFGIHRALIKLPDCKTCSVIWSDNEEGWEHVSVSPLKQFNVPTWKDMCVVKDTFFNDEEEAYQIHPKKSCYVNCVENCLHLWKPKGHEIDELVKESRT